ncbi:hypothetical protein [Enterocloster clostridioformis]|uniref:Uncharacterized protein n=1 Tax=Enterocloster clostridioformis TaxID=1531 RepID=A0AAP9LW74_9FIRM|nr:hypothetical protein [Enterocloster clostridioformis]QIX89166.1 hypothetical protein FOC47_00340 [Enterocloster clostridioformis]
MNQTCKNIYFELNGNKALVIIPHDWIKWLAPSKNIMDKQIAENNKLEETELDKLISYIEDVHDFARKQVRSFFMNDKEYVARCMGIEDILSYIENEMKSEQRIKKVDSLISLATDRLSTQHNHWKSND